MHLAYFLVKYLHQKSQQRVISCFPLCYQYNLFKTIFAMHGPTLPSVVDNDFFKTLNGKPFKGSTVKPLITNTSEEFIKCRLDNLSMSFILHCVNFSICENK